MKSMPSMSKDPIPPIDFMSSPVVSDLGATLLSKDEDEDEDEDEESKYAVVSSNLCGFEYIPGHGADNHEGSGRSDTHLSLGRYCHPTKYDESLGKLWNFSYKPRKKTKQQDSLFKLLRITCKSFDEIHRDFFRNVALWQ